MVYFTHIHQDYFMVTGDTYVWQQFTCIGEEYKDTCAYIDTEKLKVFIKLIFSSDLNPLIGGWILAAKPN